jgi:hypothetical protein
MSLLAEIEAWLAATGMPARVFGAQATGDPKLMLQMRRGRTPGDMLAERLRAFMTGNDGFDWLRDGAEALGCVYVKPPREPGVVLDDAPPPAETANCPRIESEDRRRAWEAARGSARLLDGYRRLFATRQAGGMAEARA